MTNKPNLTLKEAPFQPCVIVPVYNHPHALACLINEIEQINLPLLFVDDGSDLETRSVLEKFSRQYDFITLIAHPENRGKGEAIKTALRKASKLGFTHGLQIDADGQHALKDISRFLDEAQKSPRALVSGYPAFDQSIPKVRYYGRYLSHIWVWINTLSFTIKDSMCGFRVYPIQQSCWLIDKERMGNRMDFDGEFIVRWFWAFRCIRQLETTVTYPSENQSHFKLVRDNLLISRMHARLFFGMLIRLPKLLFAKRTCNV